MVSTFDPRHNARLLCLEMLFEEDFKKNLISKQSSSDTHDITNFEKFNIDQLKEYSEVSSYNVDLFEKIFSGVSDNLNAIDSIIREFALERPIEEISKIDLNILRIAIAEVLYLKITPTKVALDESVELAKEFGGIENGAFVNGVLDKIFKKFVKLP